MKRCKKCYGREVLVIQHALGRPMLKYKKDKEGNLIQLSNIVTEEVKCYCKDIND